jgi:hypothetical protein
LTPWWICWFRRQQVQSQNNHGKNFTRAQVKRRQAQLEESEIAATSSPETLACHGVAIVMTLP